MAVKRPESTETLIVYAERGSWLYERLLEAVLDHRGFIPIDGTWYELITWGPSPEAEGFVRWLARRVLVGAA